MKKTIYIPVLLAIATLTACDSGDNLPVQQPEDYSVITFSAQTQRMHGESLSPRMHGESLTTRANPYEAYDPSRHPLTMGVFGYYNIASYTELSATRAVAMPNPVFSNDTQTYDNTTGTWGDNLKKRWDDYRGAKMFDFFAYMPQTTGAYVERTATDTYTLSVPFTMPESKPFLLSTKQAPIICALPEHKEGTTASGKEFTFERVVNMQFDQTLTAYTLHFRLDPKMGAVRSFRIKSVSLSGNNAYAGNITRSYSWDGNAWTAADILWTDLKRTADTDLPTALPNSANNSQADDALVVTAADYSQWGTAFYVIPDQQFLPTISVTYDVELTAEDGSTVITRKGITSTIVLNKKNFTGLSTGKTAMISPIRILIQPRYLYVLADEDAYTGHLLID